MGYKPKGMPASKTNKPVVSDAIKKYVKNTINIETEMKHTVFELNTTASSSTSFLQLNNISVGTSDILRIGDQITPMHLTYGINVACADSTNIVRLVCFQWNDSSTPTEALLFEGTAVHALLTGGFNRDSQHGKKLRIVFDKLYYLNTVARPNFAEKGNISLKSLRKMRYLAGSATSGNNNLWFAYISDSAAVTHPTVQFAGIMDFADN